MTRRNNTRRSQEEVLTSLTRAIANNLSVVALVKEYTKWGTVEATYLMHDAILHNRNDVLLLLLKQNATSMLLTQSVNSVTIPLRDTNNTLLHTAVLYSATTSIPLLIEYGADVNAYNNENLTPMHLAINMEQLEAVQIFLLPFARLHFLTRPDAIPYFYDAVYMMYLTLKARALDLRVNIEGLAEVRIVRFMDEYLHLFPLTDIETAIHQLDELSTDPMYEHHLHSIRVHIWQLVRDNRLSKFTPTKPTRLQAPRG